MRLGVLVGVGILALLLVLSAGCRRPPPAPPPTPTPRLVAPPPAPTPTPPPAPAPPADLIERGKRVFIQGTNPPCVACHAIQGIPEAVGTLGPELTRIGTVAATRKPGVSAEEYIREAIEDPAAFVVEGFPPAMPPGLKEQLSPEDFEALVAFLLSLK